MRGDRPDTRMAVAR